MQDDKKNNEQVPAAEEQTHRDVEGVAGAESGAADGGRRRPQPRSSLLPFGVKSRPEPKERPVDEINVSDGALASIIGLAAHEVPGVVGMAPASLSEGIRRILGVSQVDEGVTIEHPNGAQRAHVDLHVVVAYGVNIPVVAESIRERVKYAADSLAGITLDEVRVHVAGISRG